MDNLFKECRSIISPIRSIARLHVSGDVPGIDELKRLLIQYFEINKAAIDSSKSSTAGELTSEQFLRDLFTCLEELVEFINNVLIRQGI